MSKDIGKALQAGLVYGPSGPPREARGLNTIVYRCPSDDEIRVELGVQVTAQFQSNEQVSASVTPAGEAAVATYYGAYSGLGAAYEAINSWCAANGRQQAGVNWEVYGHWTEDLSQLRTDVYALLI